MTGKYQFSQQVVLSGSGVKLERCSKSSSFSSSNASRYGLKSDLSFNIEGRSAASKPDWSDETDDASIDFRSSTSQLFLSDAFAASGVYAFDENTGAYFLYRFWNKLDSDDMEASSNFRGVASIHAKSKYSDHEKKVSS